MIWLYIRIINTIFTIYHRFTLSIFDETSISENVQEHEFSAIPSVAVPKSVSCAILGPETKYLGRFLTQAPVSKSCAYDILQGRRVRCIGTRGMRVTYSLRILFRISTSRVLVRRSTPFSVCLLSLVRRKTRGNRLQSDAGERENVPFLF